MKRCFLWVISMMLTLNISLKAADYTVEGEKIIFTKVYEDTELSIQSAHQLLESYFAMQYNDVNSTCKLNQENRLMYKGNYALLEQAYNVYVRAEHIIEVAIKENRARVRITVDKMIFHGGTNQIYDYMIVKAAPFNTGRQPFNVTKKFASYYFGELQKRIESTFNDIENVLKKQSKITDDDW